MEDPLPSSRLPRPGPSVTSRSTASTLPLPPAPTTRGDRLPPRRRGPAETKSGGSQTPFAWIPTPLGPGGRPVPVTEILTTPPLSTKVARPTSVPSRPLRTAPARSGGVEGGGAELHPVSSSAPATAQSGTLTCRALPLRAVPHFAGPPAG